MTHELREPVDHGHVGSSRVDDIGCDVDPTTTQSFLDRVGHVYTLLAVVIDQAATNVFYGRRSNDQFTAPQRRVWWFTTMLVRWRWDPTKLGVED